MKKVVDINYLCRPELEDYLARSNDNRVVFTDFARMETCKCNAVKNLVRSLGIVSRYPTRVILLKQTREIVRLTLGPSKVPECLIDVEQTIGFHDFCKQNRDAQKGDIFVTEQILSEQLIASQYFEEQLQPHQFKVDVIKGLAKSYDPSQLKALRSRKELSPDILEKITKDVLLLTAHLFKEHPDVQAPPTSEYLKNSYVFRYAVSAYLLCLKWIRDGGFDQVAPEKLRNDAVDMSYVAYATYFDGLLSLDKKLNEIYIDTLNYLHCFSGP